MNLLQRFSKALGFQETRTAKQIEEAERATNKYFAALAYLGRGPIWNDDNVQNYVEQGYARNPDVYAVVSSIAAKTASLDVKLVEYVKGEEVEIEGHPVLELIYKPNEEQSKFEFIEQISGYLLTTGNAYDYIRSPEDGPEAGIPLDMFCMPAQFMEVVGGDMGNPVAGYTMSLWGGIEGAQFSTDEIIHFKKSQYLYGDGQERYGMSPLRAAWRSVETGNSGYDANKKGLDNMGPPGVLFDKGMESITDTLDETQQKNLEAKFRKMSGIKNSGTIAVTSGNLGYINFGLSPIDLAIMETMDMTLTDVCNVYHVQPQLFGSEKGKTYSNLQEARKAFYTDAILPLADRIYSKFTRSLLPRYKDLKGRNVALKVVTDNVPELQADMKELASWLSTAYWLTPNEARQKMNYEPKDDPMMDEVYMGAGRVPLSLAGMDVQQVASQVNGDSLNDQ